jgi:hypothetical protein
MKKQSEIGIIDTIQEVVHNIELKSLLISIILGGAVATLFFLNSLSHYLGLRFAKVRGINGRMHED